MHPFLFLPQDALCRLVNRSKPFLLHPRLIPLRIAPVSAPVNWLHSLHSHSGQDTGKIMILIIYAHPYPHHSHANRRMLEHVQGLDDIEVRSLYQLYPDFNINVPAEQEALARADLIVWQHPMQWYSVPPLFKLWIDKVLSHGWAYGKGGTALRGKSVLWAVTTGGDKHHFDLGDHPGFDVLAQPLQATALYCGLNWLTPYAMHRTFVCDDETLEGKAREYLKRLTDWQERHHG